MWWKVSLSVPVPTLTLYTDASNLAWGTYLEGSWALGLLSLLQQKEHINLLEMKAVHLALSHFRTLHLKSLVLATDNTTVVAYLKNQGGTHCFSLYSLCREILLRCSELQIQLVVRHIPGHLNVLADTLVTLSSTSEHGMGITTSNVQCHQSSLGSFSSGSVCYVSEPQAGYFRFSSSRSSSIRCRRNVNLLERNACLRSPSLSNCLHGALLCIWHREL
jgi:hypothetical protein